MKPAFDDSYLDGLRHHDPATEEHLVCCFSEALKAPLRRRLRRTQVIEDVTQETLVRVLTYFRAGKTLRAASSLPAFVNSVSSNVSRELWRAEGRDEPLGVEYDTVPDVHSNPELAVIAREHAQIVRQTLAQLPLKDQQVLESVFLKESDKDQVCKQLHTTRNHLRVLLHRAMRRFRTLAEQHHSGSLPTEKHSGIHKIPQVRNGPPST